MLRRFSSQFKRDKNKSQDNGNGITNGTTNGYVNGETNGQVNGTREENGGGGRFRRKSTFGSSKAEQPDHSANREEVSNTFESFAQLIHASQRPLPSQTGNGTYIEHEMHSSLFQDLRSLGFKDAKTLRELMANKMAGSKIDDKTYLMERIIQLVSALPQRSKTRADLTNAFIDELWCNMQHPPMSYLGDKFTYRQADGSYNNVLYPHLGAANTPYARSVQPLTIQPGALPDPGLIFDSIFARQTFREHPNKVSSVFFYWASIIIHDLFQTDHQDVNISKTSSYLDLSPLYGDTQEDQDKIRTFKDGKLKPDCFAEERLLAFPPGCGVLLIMLNRFHNYVVEQLAMINENGRFTSPGVDPRLRNHPELQEQSWKKYDNDLFQTGRLITCGLYINITLLDYLRTIVNLNRSNTTWTLDPRIDMEGKVFGKDGTPRGIGNQVSAEFNLAYRWHSCTSKRDEEWTEEMYTKLFGKPSSQVSMPEMLAGLSKWYHELEDDPHQRDFAGLQRQADGKYNDDDLVEIITSSIEDCAGAFGAQHVPKALRAVEILGMMQARKWNLATLNEFRDFFGLARHETFESINSDPEVANALRHLYEHPDFVEMYPGIVAEEAKVPMVPGVGIAPTFTISRAILSDAVTLVRGDRFYTTDYHPKNLTNWGYCEAQYDFNIEQGCVLYKLFLRSFPNHFKPDSIYAHYPMTIPSENRKIMQTLGREHHYSYDRPGPIPQRLNVFSVKAAFSVLDRQDLFHVTWGGTLTELMGKGGSHFMLSGDTQLHAKQRQVMKESLYRDQWHKQVKQFYEHITLKLLHEKSFKLAAINHVDITRDVGNLAHVHFAANVFSLPLKTEEHPRGVFTEHELYMGIAAIFICIFFDFEPTKSFPLHMVARKIAGQMGKIIEANVKAVNMTGLIAGLVDGMTQNKHYLTDYGVHMVRRLLEAGLSAEEVAWSQIFPVACAMVPNQAQVFTQCLDYYLAPGAGAAHLPEIQRLARQDDDASFEKLMHYCMEGIRLNGTFGSYREAQADTTVPDPTSENPGQAHNVRKGDKVFTSFVSANRDPTRFPNPNEVDPNRPLESYIHYGIGSHTCLGRDASRVALTSMLKVVGRLDNLKRVKGPKGELKKIPRPGGFYVYMREDHGSYFPFPLTWQVCWTGDLPPLTKG